MSSQLNIQSHFVVEWADSKNEFAIVHIQRAKSVIEAALKTGSTALFVGNNRERRRGKILFVGNKKDAITFSLDFEEIGGALDLSAWCEPPVSRENAEETRNVRTITGTQLQRTTSSSSYGSGKASNNSVKKKKAKNDERKSKADSHDSQEYAMPLTSTSTMSNLASRKNIDFDQTDDEDIECVSKSTANDKTQSTVTDSSSNDVCKLVEENKRLMEKVLVLQNELVYERDSSVRIPNETCYSFLKSICVLYERMKNEKSQQVVDLGNKLPCSAIDLKLAKKSNPSATINNLVKVCFKDIDLKQMSYEKLKNVDSTLLENIHEYVQCVHAPMIISQTMFSGTISLKCRHLRENEKSKKDENTTTGKQSQARKSSQRVKNINSSKVQSTSTELSEVTNIDLIE